MIACSGAGARSPPCALVVVLLRCLRLLQVCCDRSHGYGAGGPQSSRLAVGIPRRLIGNVTNRAAVCGQTL